MKTIITPIGTSLISNYIDNFLAEKENRKINENVIAIYNDIRDNIPIEDSDLEDIKEDLKEYLKNYENSCAEKTSINKIKESNKDKIILIVSETKISEFLGNIFKEYFNNCEIEKIDGLQVENKDRFENEGLHNFIEFFKTLDKKNIIFNITAGYKAFIPYLVIIGQVYNVPIKYIFEESSDLISIPKLPIGFNDEIADLYLPYLNNFLLEKLILQQNIKSKLLEYGFIKDENNKLSLSILGELFKNYMNHKPSYFGDLMEYLLLGIYIKDNNIKIEKSKNYKFEGQSGDIDLILKSNNNIEFIEVKSFGQFKTFKNKQLEKYTNYILQNYSNYSKTISILFYLLDNNLLNEYIKDFKEINNNLKSKNIDFMVKYIEIKPEKFQKFIREFDKQYEIKEFIYE